MCAAAAARLLVGPRSTAVAARGVILTDELMVRRGGELAEQQLLTGLSALSLSLSLSNYPCLVCSLHRIISKSEEREGSQSRSGDR